ncbi:MAG: endopeptidase La, partial [Spirochaetota bacterium]|nr:endopeptidase La [Spirochaetota bacterium]
MDYEDNEFDNHLISIEQIIPKQIFILPVLGSPIFPGIITPIIVTSPSLVDTINSIGDSLDFVGLVLARDENMEDFTSSNLHEVGTIAKIVKKMNLPNGGVNLLVNSLKRFKVLEYIVDTPARMIAKVDYPEEKDKPSTKEESIEIKALTRAILSQLRTLAENNPFLMEQIKLTLANIDQPSKISDFAVTLLRLSKEEYQEILETFDVEARLEKVLRNLDKEVKLIELQKNIQKQIDGEIDQKQREFFLKEQLKAIKHELGMEDDPHNKEYQNFVNKMDELSFPEDVEEQVDKELEKFANLDPHSSEYVVTRNYLDTILSLPWGIFTKDSHDLNKAERVLNADHYGLEDVKERILEFLAVRKLNPESTGGSIICLVGPPGVGKTSLGKSIARSLNRKFYRFSLGGMRDEAEIKGHRRTYVGAMPGKILLGLKVVKSANPVFMLDEIDKIGMSYQGDPASALLEVLDPEQNTNFVDHYLDLPFDLSTILFITTANTLDSIPRPLLDRMEVIRLSGYIEEEKYEIGKRYLLPKQLKKHGLTKNHIKLSKKTYGFIINNYAREAGVRNLERYLEKICRKTASLVAREKEYDSDITPEKAREYLGPEIFTDDFFEKKQKPGVVTGLAWTAYGGSVLFIESIAIKGKSDLKLTGQLGDVMMESANIAYSYVKKTAVNHGVKEDFFENHSIHLHVPAGATPKDGPSAGITMATSMLSLSRDKPIKKLIGM